MLYTIMPLERIYATPYRSNNMEKDKKEEVEAEFKEMDLQHGRVVTRRQGEDYVIERINSTDMNDYLRQEYSPGNNYKK